MHTMLLSMSFFFSNAHFYLCILEIINQNSASNLMNHPITVARDIHFPDNISGMLVRVTTCRTFYPIGE